MGPMEMLSDYVDQNENTGFARQKKTNGNVERLDQNENTSLRHKNKGKNGKCRT
jgi:hypothetical protein